MIQTFSYGKLNNFFFVHFALLCHEQRFKLQGF